MAQSKGFANCRKRWSVLPLAVLRRKNDRFRPVSAAVGRRGACLRKPFSRRSQKAAWPTVMRARMYHSEASEYLELLRQFAVTGRYLAIGIASSQPPTLPCDGIALRSRNAFATINMPSSPAPVSTRFRYGTLAAPFRNSASRRNHLPLRGSRHQVPTHASHIFVGQSSVDESHSSPSRPKVVVHYRLCRAALFCNGVTCRPYFLKLSVASDRMSRHIVQNISRIVSVGWPASNARSRMRMIQPSKAIEKSTLCRHCRIYTVL